VVNPVQTLRTASGVGIDTTRSTLQPCSLSNVFKTTGNTGHSPNILSQVCIIHINICTFNYIFIILLVIISYNLTFSSYNFEHFTENLIKMFI